MVQSWQCQNARMLECWNAGMPGMPAGPGMPECWNARMLESMNCGNLDAVVMVFIII